MKSYLCFMTGIALGAGVFFGLCLMESDDPPLTPAAVPALRSLDATADLSCRVYSVQHETRYSVRGSAHNTGSSALRDIRIVVVLSNEDDIVWHEEVIEIAFLDSRQLRSFGFYVPLSNHVFRGLEAKIAHVEASR